MTVFYATPDGVGSEHWGLIAGHPILLTYFNVQGRQAWVMREVLGGGILFGGTDLREVGQPRGSGLQHDADLLGDSGAP